MEKTILFAAALAALPMAAIAQSAIDGTWKIDARTLKTPTVSSKYAVKGGLYECLTCKPAIKIKADGKDHAVKNPGIDAVAVNIIDNNTLEVVSKREGKDAGKSKVVVAADGKSMTRENSTLETSGLTTTSKMLWKRVGEAPAGGHAMSGEWKMDKLEALTETTVTFKTTGKVIAMTSQEGGAYEATLGGGKAAVRGDPGTAAVTVKMKGADFLEETAYRKDGKPFLVSTIKVAPDGKKAEYTWTNLNSKGTGGYTLVKQ